MTFNQVILMKTMEYVGIPHATQGFIQQSGITDMFDRKTDMLVFTYLDNYEAVNVIRLQLSRCDKGVPVTLL